MRFTQITRRLALLTAFAIVPLLLWGAAPDASQDNANEGFILFTSDRAHPSKVRTCPNCEDIYVMRPDGTSLDGSGEPTRLTYGGGALGDPGTYNSTGVDWSHSKKVIAFHTGRAGFPEIFLMNADGSNQQALASLGTSGAVWPSFSHNGNELCFNSQVRPRDIYIVNIHGTGLTNLTETNLTESKGDNLRCDWSPKSNTIAFGSTRHDRPTDIRNEEIYVMNADGSDVVRLTGDRDAGQDEAPGADANPAWSPAGDRIAFESNRDGNPEIYLMDADGGNQERLTFNDGQDTKPTWSPKGDRIAFQRRIAGHLQVFTMNRDGSDVRAITETIAPGFSFSGFPSWGKWGAIR